MTPKHPDVHTYYNGTGFDYRAVWNRRRRDVAVHFGYYDEQADRHAEALDNLNRVMADFAGICPGERVLDAGCGFGNAAFWLAAQRGAQVTGVNIVAGQIEACRKHAARLSGPGPDFVCADYCNMPFPDASFDVVWACESVCHAESKAAFYREAFRVLKPGGRLVLAEYLRSTRPLSPASEQLLSDWLRPWAIPDIDTAEEHRAAAGLAGFKNTEIRDITPNMRVSLRNLHEISSRWLPLGRFFNKLGWVSDVRIGNARASVRQYEALLEQAWHYGLLKAEK